jgi:serine/threonine protein phosphatase PrpC
VLLACGRPERPGGLGRAPAAGAARRLAAARSRSTSSPRTPLALEHEVRALPPEADVDLPPGTALLLHSDGLVERRSGATVLVLDPVLLATGLPPSLAAAADQVLAAAARAGAAQDDVTLLLVRPRS